MDIINLKEVESTHSYLRELIRKDGFTKPVCVCADYQTNGIGSRGNLWEGKDGNLFFSFVILKNDLPQDLQLQSSSIYFSFILKQILESQGSKLWLKWPNDFYIDNKKIGGTITTVTKDLLYCGIGLNLQRVNKKFGALDIKIDKKNILNLYFKSLKKKSSWKEIFNYFQIEFQKSKKYKVTIEDKKISMDKAILNDDGSIQIDDKKVFSSR